MIYPIQVKDSSKAKYRVDRDNDPASLFYSTKGAAMEAALVCIYNGATKAVVVNRSADKIVYDAAERYNTDKVLLSGVQA